MEKVGSTEIRNRLKNKTEKKCGEKIETPELLNECSWDAVSVAKRKLQILPKNAPQAKPLDKKQLEDVKRVSDENFKFYSEKKLFSHIFFIGIRILCCKMEHKLNYREGPYFVVSFTFA